MARTLLVADKSIVIQKSVGITFAQEDFKVAYANDGEEALSRVRQMKPDCLLVHTGIPKRDGYAVCEAVKNDPQLGTTPVLLLVGTHEAYDEAKGQAVKADGYVIKPFESQALIERVNTLLSGQAVASPSQPAEAPVPPSQVETAVSSPPQPPAQQPAPPLPDPVPSPASTIAGQAPQAQPSPEPAVPDQPEPMRDAPMLDIEPPAPAEATAAPVAEEPLEPAEDVFDFSFEDAPESDTKVSETPAPSLPETPAPEPIAPSEPLAASEPLQTPAEAANEGEFWDFSEETAVETPASAPQTETPMIEPEVDFGFDVTDEGASEPTVSFDAPSEQPEAAIPQTETAPTPEPVPEEGVEISFGEMPPMDEEPSFAEEPSTEFASEPLEIEPPAPATAEDSIPIETLAEAASPSVETKPVELSPDQVEEVVTKVFRQVIERIAWEVVPDLAETIIKEELERLTKNSS